MGHISVHCVEHFHEIQGNLQRQIQQIKNVKKDRQKEDSDGESNSLEKLPFADGDEADDETEEIKTEQFILT